MTEPLKYKDIKLTTDKDVVSKKSYKIVWDNISNKKGEVKIDSKMYNKDKWEFEIGGENYICEFVDGDSTSKPCELDLKNMHFYINRNNVIIQSLKSEYIILCILIEYSRATSKTKEEQTEKLFSLLYW
jgi:hypothetical protein